MSVSPIKRHENRNGLLEVWTGLFAWGILKALPTGAAGPPIWNTKSPMKKSVWCLGFTLSTSVKINSSYATSTDALSWWSKAAFGRWFNLKLVYMEYFIPLRLLSMQETIEWPQYQTNSGYMYSVRLCYTDIKIFHNFVTYIEGVCRRQATRVGWPGRLLHLKLIWPILCWWCWLLLCAAKKWIRCRGNGRFRLVRRLIRWGVGGRVCWGVGRGISWWVSKWVGRLTCRRVIWEWSVPVNGCSEILWWSIRSWRILTWK